MIILLSSVESTDIAPTLEVRGEVVIVNGEEFDFGILPAGYSLPRFSVDSPWFVDSTITRDHDGVLTLPIRFPYPADANETLRFPEPIIVTKDGPVDLPKYIAPEVPTYEDFPGPGDEDPNTGEFGSTDVVPEGYTVPPIDGLDGAASAGDDEGGTGSGIEETSGSSGTSDRGDQ